MDRPNILFLLSDEHSFRFLSCLPPEAGGEPVRTPHLDLLAEHGTWFTDAYCQMPLCTPSRLCLLAGREVRGAGAWTNGSVLRPGIPTLPSVLAQAGYATCLIGKMHLGGSRQFVGFQARPYGDLTGKTGHQWEPLNRPEARSMRGRTAAADVTEIPESLLQEQVVAQETIAFLREHQARSPEQPWFLMASFSRPHFPLTAPRRWIGRYSPEAIPEPRVPAAGDAYDHPMSVGMRRGFQAEAISQEEMMRARGAYFACVSYLDEVIGDLLLRLEHSGLLENTIVVYTSDHGEMAGEHGVWWKNGWYEACTRVPLILSTPQQRAGKSPARRIGTPVALIDLFPTLCRLAGVEPPEGLDGVDLSATVRGSAEPPDRPIVCDALVPRWGAGTEFRMVRWRQFKYVRFRNAPPLFFNLETDPGEQRNLLQRSRTPEESEALRILEEFVDRTMDFEQAEWERTVRDASLREQFALDVPTSTPNLYWMPDGRMINADDPLYHPTVIVEDPSAVFADFPEDQGKNGSGTRSA